MSTLVLSTVALNTQQSKEEMPVERIARITTRSNVIIPPHSEVLANGILQGKMDIPMEGIIQLQGRFLEKYHVGVASVLGRRREIMCLFD